MDEQMKAYYDMINQQQQMNNAWSAEQAQKAMDYQTEMSNTAHQREVADLKAAGLNPVLSAGGQGATTGTGHAAQAGNENVQALYGLISKQIDAQMEQAKAMANSAKAVSGSAGRSNPIASSQGSKEQIVSVLNSTISALEEGSFSDEEAEKLMLLAKTDDVLADEIVQPLFDWIQRKTGVKATNLKKALSKAVSLYIDYSNWASKGPQYDAVMKLDKALRSVPDKVKKVVYTPHKIRYTGTNARGSGSAKQLNYNANRTRSSHTI